LASANLPAQQETGAAVRAAAKQLSLSARVARMSLMLAIPYPKGSRTDFKRPSKGRSGPEPTEGVEETYRCCLSSLHSAWRKAVRREAHAARRAPFPFWLSRICRLLQTGQGSSDGQGRFCRSRGSHRTGPLCSLMQSMDPLLPVGPGGAVMLRLPGLSFAAAFGTACYVRCRRNQSKRSCSCSGVRRFTTTNPTS